MKHIRMLVTIGAVVAAAAALAVSGASAQGPQALQLLSVQQHQSMIGLGPGEAPIVGARLVFNDVLYNRVAQFGKPSGARVGSADGLCTIVSNHHAQCVVTAHVPNGQMVTLGSIVLRRGLGTDRFAVVGGIGAYSSARGTVTARDITPTKTLIAIRLNG
jgi:hypothetical protein